jgi:ABC-type multidrug transport system ATPase subunit
VVTHILEARGVWKSYGSKDVLRGIDFSVDDYTVNIILGRNGVGKTTFIKVLSGLIRPSKGVIEILGEDIRDSEEYKLYIGVLLHENVLYDEMTVRENLDYYARMYGLDSFMDSRFAQDAYRLFGFERYIDFKVSELSFGWRKRANIIRCLINDPKIVILDEPSSGLDEVATSQVANLLHRLSKVSTIVFTMSNLEDLNILLDKGLGDAYIFRLEDGRLGIYERA